MRLEERIAELEAENEQLGSLVRSGEDLVPIPVDETVAILPAEGIDPAISALLIGGGNQGGRPDPARPVARRRRDRSQLAGSGAVVLAGLH